MKDGFQINEISKFFNVPASTLRYWEEMGVLAAKKNPENGYRIYTVSDLMTISDILFYKNLGIPLKKNSGHGENGFAGTSGFVCATSKNNPAAAIGFRTENEKASVSY